MEKFRVCIKGQPKICRFRLKNPKVQGSRKATTPSNIQYCHNVLCASTSFLNLILFYQKFSIILDVWTMFYPYIILLFAIWREFLSVNRFIIRLTIGVKIFNFWFIIYKYFLSCSMKLVKSASKCDTFV